MRAIERKRNTRQPSDRLLLENGRATNFHALCLSDARVRTIVVFPFRAGQKAQDEDGEPNQISYDRKGHGLPRKPGREVALKNVNHSREGHQNGEG